MVGAGVLGKFCLLSLVPTALVAAPGVAAGTSSDDSTPWILYQWGTPCGTGPPGAGLCLVREDGSEAHAILVDAGDVKDPEWSPDGQSITYVASSTPGQLWIADFDGANRRPVIADSGRCPAEARVPAWSPDGTKLAFMCLHAVVDIASGAVEEVYTAALHEEAWNPRWSPDGQQLVFERDPNDGVDVTGGEVVVVDAAGRDATAITPASMFGGYPDWSPDGDVIVFSTYGIDLYETGGPGASNLYTVRPDGSQLAQLTEYPTGGDRAGHPSFSPDGTRIIFTLIHGDDFGGYGQRRPASIGLTGSDLETVDGVWATHPRLQP
jgi:Tol biopolymer transport system component